MDKTIVTALLVVAGVISAVLVFNAIYPAIAQGSDAMTSMGHRIDERMQTQIQVVEAAKLNNSVMIWIKNVGTARILAPESSDLFFGPQGNFSRIPYGTGTPSWTFAIENDTLWNPSATLRVTIIYSSPPPSGTYYVKMVLPNGISDDYFVSW